MNGETKLKTLLSLDDIIADPSGMEDITPQEAGEMLVKLSSIQTILMSRVLSGNGNGNHAQQDELLTVEEAANRLNTSVDWIRRHTKTLPFTVRISPKQVRFSAKKIETYLKNRPR